MKLLLDMNLSPAWLPLLHSHGFEAVHWSEVGDGRSPDHEIMRWAREHGCVVFTHDLDFGLLLAHPCGRSERHPSTGAGRDACLSWLVGG